jgi:hypothetical protein
MHLVVDETCEGDADAAKALADATEPTAHRHTALLRDGDHGDGPDAVRAADMAASATLALIAGRSALRRPGG